MPGPPLLGVGDSVGDHDMDETVLHQVQKALLLIELRSGSISGMVGDIVCDSPFRYLVRMISTTYCNGYISGILFPLTYAHAACCPWTTPGRPARPPVEVEALLAALSGLRASLLDTLVGLSEGDARRSTVASGTNLAGLVQRLTDGETQDPIEARSSLTPSR
jgi:hypothetical protein